MLFQCIVPTGAPGMSTSDQQSKDSQLKSGRQLADEDRFKKEVERDLKFSQDAKSRNDEMIATVKEMNKGSEISAQARLLVAESRAATATAIQQMFAPKVDTGTSRVEANRKQRLKNTVRCLMPGSEFHTRAVRELVAITLEIPLEEITPALIEMVNLKELVQPES